MTPLSFCTFGRFLILKFNQIWTKIKLTRDLNFFYRRVLWWISSQHVTNARLLGGMFSSHLESGKCLDERRERSPRGVNFIDIFCKAFTHADPKSAMLIFTKLLTKISKIFGNFGPWNLEIIWALSTFWSRYH